MSNQVPYSHLQKEWQLWFYLELHLEQRKLLLEMASSLNAVSQIAGSQRYPVCARSTHVPTNLFLL